MCPNERRKRRCTAEISEGKTRFFPDGREKKFHVFVNFHIDGKTHQPLWIWGLVALILGFCVFMNRSVGIQIWISTFFSERYLSYSLNFFNGFLFYKNKYLSRNCYPLSQPSICWDPEYLKDLCSKTDVRVTKTTRAEAILTKEFLAKSRCGCFFASFVWMHTKFVILTHFGTTILCISIFF